MNGFHLPFPRHDSTTFVRFQTSGCTGCGRCVEVCRKQVLGLTPLRWHRHVHVDDSTNCVGCLRCVATCPNGRIRPRFEAKKGIPARSEQS